MSSNGRDFIGDFFGPNRKGNHVEPPANLDPLDDESQQSSNKPVVQDESQERRNSIDPTSATAANDYSDVHRTMAQNHQRASLHQRQYSPHRQHRSASDHMAPLTHHKKKSKARKLVEDFLPRHHHSKDGVNLQDATSETIVIYTHAVFDHEPTIERELIRKFCTKAYPLVIVNSERDLLLVKHPIALLVWHDVEVKHPDIIEHLAERGLHCIVRVGAGYEHIDHESCALKGIVVSSIPSFGVDEMADSTMCMILNMLRGTHRIASRMRNENRFLTITEFGMCHRVRGTHLGLVGLGAIGTSVALRAKAFGMKVSFYDPYIPEGFEKSLNLHRAHSLVDLLQRSDVISLHSGINGETRHMISRESIKLMRKGSYLINNGRGGLVEEEAVIEALESGQLGGVALDVLDNEKFYDGRLRDVPNLMLTAHSSFFSAKALKEMRKNATLEALRIIKGGFNRAKYCVNKRTFVKKRTFTARIERKPIHAAIRERTGEDTVSLDGTFVEAAVRRPHHQTLAVEPALEDVPVQPEDCSYTSRAAGGDIFHPSSTELPTEAPISPPHPNLREQEAIQAPSSHQHWLPRTERELYDEERNGEAYYRRGENPLDYESSRRAPPPVGDRVGDRGIIIRPDHESQPHIIAREDEVPALARMRDNPHATVIEEVTGRIIQRGDAFEMQASMPNEKESWQRVPLKRVMEVDDTSAAEYVNPEEVHVAHVGGGDGMGSNSKVLHTVPSAHSSTPRTAGTSSSQYDGQSYPHYSEELQKRYSSNSLSMGSQPASTPASAYDEHHNVYHGGGDAVYYSSSGEYTPGAPASDVSSTSSMYYTRR